jgi:hypothetical protein
MHHEPKAGALADALYKPIDGVCGEGAAAFGFEYEVTLCFCVELPESPNLIAAERMNTWLAVLGPPDMQGR